jgi:hypothetical protein
VNGTVIGTLAGGVLLFLSSILVPVISKRLNRATDAATSAETLSKTAVSLTTEMKDRMVSAEKKCDECLGALGEMRRRAERRDRSLDAVHAALLEIVPLLPADSTETAMLRAAIHTVQQARYENEP